MLAADIAVLLIGGVVLLLTRSAGTLTRWLLRAHRLLARTLHWPHDATWVDHAVAELTRVRALVAERRRMIGLLVLIQWAYNYITRNRGARLITGDGCK